MRGRTAAPQAAAAAKDGLSPRARGNQRLAVSRHHAVGSIPACAGEPAITAAEAVKVTVYPRVRGGTRTSISTAQFPHGLSPRARGNPSRRECLPGRLGSIPACAGEPP